MKTKKVVNKSTSLRRTIKKKQNAGGIRDFFGRIVKKKPKHTNSNISQPAQAPAPPKLDLASDAFSVDPPSNEYKNPLNSNITNNPLNVPSNEDIEEVQHFIQLI